MQRFSTRRLSPRGLVGNNKCRWSGRDVAYGNEITGSVVRLTQDETEEVPVPKKTYRVFQRGVLSRGLQQVTEFRTLNGPS